jgi:hypothetical protein
MLTQTGTNQRDTLHRLHLQSLEQDWGTLLAKWMEGARKSRKKKSERTEGHVAKSSWQGDTRRGESSEYGGPDQNPNKPDPTPLKPEERSM